MSNLFRKDSENMSRSNIIKVNLGCGPIGKDDWINIDYGLLALLAKYPLLKKIALKLRILPERYAKWEWPKNLMIHDCRKRLPFKDNSVDYIYTSHLIEHFSKYEAISLLKECFRILKPGGYIRVVVPDLELIARKYLERDRNFFITDYSYISSRDLPLADLFLMFFYPEKNRKPPTSLIDKIYYKFARWHKWHYDFESLNLILSGCGFVGIEKKRYHEGKVPDIEFLDAHPKQSLFVEATKPM